jgi:hypothetical protein
VIGEVFKGFGVMMHREPKHNVRGRLTYSVEIVAKHLKQMPISLLAIIITSMYINGCSLLPFVSVDPVGEVTVQEVELRTVVGFDPLGEILVDDVLFFVDDGLASEFSKEHIDFALFSSLNYVARG